MAFRFLDLPGEIRNLVYEYCFDVKREIPKDPHWNFQAWTERPKCLKVLQICRKINEEAASLYYEKYFKDYLVQFKTFEDLHSFTHRVPPLYRGLFHSAVVLRAEDFDDAVNGPPSAKALRDFKAKLKVLGVGDNARWSVKQNWGHEPNRMQHKHLYSSKWKMMTGYHEWEQPEEPRTFIAAGQLGVLPWSSDRAKVKLDWRKLVAVEWEIVKRHQRMNQCLCFKGE